MKKGWLKDVAGGMRQALGLLTLLPACSGDLIQSDALSAQRQRGWAVALFPLVGAILGAILVGASWLLSPLLPEPALLALLSLVVVVLTGGLHHDGLADVCDALLAHDEKRQQEILKDPHLGSFGVLGLFVSLTLWVIGVVSMQHLEVVAAILILSRGGLTLQMALFRINKPEGMGAYWKEGFTPTYWWIALTLSLLLPLLFVPLKIALVLTGGAAVLFVLLGRWLGRKFGGMSGDLYGASLVLSESALLWGALAWLGVE